jgi:hypothetical protein
MLFASRPLLPIWLKVAYEGMMVHTGFAYLDVVVKCIVRPYFITPFNLCVCRCIPVLMIGDGSAKRIRSFHCKATVW